MIKKRLQQKLAKRIYKQSVVTLQRAAHEMALSYDWNSLRYDPPLTKKIVEGFNY